MEHVFRLTIWHRKGLPEKLMVELVRASAAGDKAVVTQTATDALQHALISALSSAAGSASGTRHLQGTLEQLLTQSRRELMDIYDTAHHHVDTSQISLGHAFVEKVLSIASLEVAILSSSDLR